MAFTHEEDITNYMKRFISSYKDLPLSAYHIQTKFRNEIRAKSGIMRGREFLMKDLYSFSRNEKEHNDFYEASKQAYMNVFNRVGIGEITYITFASGGSFSKYSHEFQTISDAGEDVVYISKEKKMAVNKEVYNDEVLKDLGLKKEELIEEKAIEVGNIFTLGYKFSEAIGLNYKNEDGEEKPVFMGSYGIGPTRLMGTIVEILSDDKGIVWPEAVAPFCVHLISLDKDEEAEKIYNTFRENGIDVLYDDRDVRPGEKFADSDLIGIPWRVVVSERALQSGGVEVKRRDSEESEIVGVNRIVEKVG